MYTCMIYYVLSISNKHSSAIKHDINIKSFDFILCKAVFPVSLNLFISKEMV